MIQGAEQLRVIALSGGVGGARLVDGLRRVLTAENLLIVANTGDDFEHLGLHVCPDLDTVMYTLAGIANPETGWGLEGESWVCLDTLARLGGEDWFRLGDRDLATHLYRSEALRRGRSLSQVTTELCAALGVAQLLVPMCDQSVRTLVDTGQGELSFQHYFVREACRPVVRGFRLAGIDQARPASAIEEFCAAGPVHAVILCPSNPYVSIDPILAVPGMRELLRSRGRPVVAVSPIVGGRALKGPAAKMMAELGIPASAAAVAAHYGDFVDVMIIDDADAGHAGTIRDQGVETLICATVMHDVAARRQLAHSLVTRLLGY